MPKRRSQGKPRGTHAARSMQRRGPACSPRRAAFERLEDRHLLATITVNTLIDVDNAGDGLTTLREAVVAAGANDTINFSVTGTINLTSAGSGHIEISKSLTIQGPGANLLTIKAFDPDGNGQNDSDGRRVFYVSNGSSSLSNVTISGLTLTNGDPDVTNEDNSLGGGAIHNEENLTLLACTLTGNFAPGGGAVASSSGILSLTDCVIDGNAAKDGGGIIIDGGSLSLTRTQVMNNEATNAGGGLLNRGRSMTVVDSTISGNMADESGGGVYLYQGSLAVTGSTISGNVADLNNDQLGAGGGIFNTGGTLNVSNSTISGNSAGEDGGGVFSDTSQDTIIDHSTLTANSVTNQSGNDGGGIRSVGTALLDHTIVAGNTKGIARNDISGSFASAFSLIGDRRSTSVNDVVGSLIGTSAAPINPLLGPLADNGGLTKTHALLTGSPAIDAGDATDLAGMFTTPLYDERGAPFGRVVDGDGTDGPRVDIGAFEAGPPVPALLGDYTRNGSVDAADYVLWRNTLGQNVTAYAAADGSGNGAIGNEDYDVWRARFGATSGTGAAEAATKAPAELAPSLSMISIQSGFATKKQLLQDSATHTDRSGPDLLLCMAAAGNHMAGNQAGLSPRIGSIQAEREAASDRLFEECTTWSARFDAFEGSPVLVPQTT